MSARSAGGNQTARAPRSVAFAKLQMNLAGKLFHVLFTCILHVMGGFAELEVVVESKTSVIITFLLDCVSLSSLNVTVLYPIAS